MISGGFYETGQEGIDELLGSVLGGGAVSGGVKSQMLQQTANKVSDVAVFLVGYAVASGGQ